MFLTWHTMTKRTSGIMDKAKRPVQPKVGMTHRASITSAQAPTAQKHWNMNIPASIFCYIQVNINTQWYRIFIQVALQTSKIPGTKTILDIQNFQLTESHYKVTLMFHRAPNRVMVVHKVNEVTGELVVRLGCTWWGKSKCGPDLSPRCLVTRQLHKCRNSHDASGLRKLRGPGS